MPKKKQQLPQTETDIMTDRTWKDGSPSTHRHTDGELAHRPASSQSSSPLQHRQRASAPTSSMLSPPTRSWYVTLDDSGTISFTEQQLNATRDLRAFARLYVGAGPHAESFNVHRDIACRYSPILETTFSDVSRGDRRHEYHLTCPEIDATVVSLLIYWFYDPDVEVNLEMPFIQNITGNGGKTAVLVKLWILADTLLIPTLQNQIVVAIEKLRKEENFTATYLLHYIFENTARDSPLRALFRDQCLWELRKSWIRDHPEEFPKDLLADMIEVLSECAGDSARLKRQPGKNMGNYMLRVLSEEPVVTEEVEDDGWIPGKEIYGGGEF